MKVLYLTNLPAPYRVDFFNEFGKEVDLTVLYERKTAADRDSRWQDRKAQRYREIYLKGFLVGAASSFSPEVLDYIKDPSFDVRIVGGYSSPTEMLAIWYMKRRNIPYILSVDGGFPATNENGFIKKLKTSLISGASLYLGTGKNATKYLTYYGAEQDRICHYHFTSLFEKDILDAPPSPEEKKKLKKMLGINAKYMILAVGRLLPLKRYDLLINAAKDMEDAWVIIIGGMADDFHKNIIYKSGAKNIQFIDFLSYKNLVPFYKAADVYVMPSDSDVWGMVLVEAMANGLPVIASEGCGAAADLVHSNTNGFLFARGNVAQLRTCLKEFLDKTEKTGSFGQKSIAYVKEYTIENEVHDHITTINRFIGR